LGGKLLCVVAVLVPPELVDGFEGAGRAGFEGFAGVSEGCSH